MEHPELEDDLMEKVEKAIGPAQKLAALKSLADLYGKEGYKERQLQYILMCLEISNGDDNLWRELGEAALHLERLPLAIYSYKACVKLKNAPENIYGLALAKALSYDYVNSLAILNFLIETQNFEPAQDLKKFVMSKIKNEEAAESPIKIAWPALKQEEPYKSIVKKVSNLYSLITTARILVDQGKWDSKVKFELSTSAAEKAITAKPAPVVINPCWDFCEQVKKIVLDNTNETFLAVVWDKTFQLSVISTKITAMLEEEIKPFFSSPMLLRHICRDLFPLLLKNNPRPSTLLSNEIGPEILHIYFQCEAWTDLSDELLTLLELSNEENIPADFRISLRTKLIMNLPESDNKEIKARTFAALALSHFKSREKFEKNREDLIQELMHAEHLAEKAINELQGATIYMWWTDTLLNESTLNKLRNDVKVDYALLDFDKLAKVTQKSVEPILRMLDTWSKVLLVHSANDDPSFYWKKMKIQLKILTKFSLNDTEKNQLCTILTRYVSVLLFNAEEGVSLKKDYDFPLLMETLTKQLSPFNVLEKSQVCKLSISLLTLMRYVPKLYNYLPFFLKRVFKVIKPSIIPEIFDVFHKNLKLFENDLEKDFHQKLCQHFEKVCFDQEKEKLLKIIYRWNYGLGDKVCKCGKKISTNILALPNSPEKLLRFLKTSEEKYEDYSYQSPEIYKNKKCYTLLEVLNQKEETLFIDCPKHNNFLHMVNSEEIPILMDCCNKEKREIASEAFKRMACYNYESSKKNELKKRMDFLKEARKFIIKAIELCPGNSEYWLILGQISFWKWIWGFFDIFYSSDKYFAKFEDGVEAVHAYNIAIKLENKNKQYIYEAKSVLCYFLSSIDKEYFFEALKSVDEAYGLYKIHSNIICVIYGLMLTKSKNPESTHILIGLSPYSEIANYKMNPTQENLAFVNLQDDHYCKYLYHKNSNSLYTLLIENNFIGSYEAKSEFEIFMERPFFMWNLISKAGIQCVKQVKTEGKEKIIEIIENVLAIKKGRRNKALSKIFMACLEELIVQGYNQDAQKYLEKISMLTPQEKKEIKVKLGADI
ncbi:unnamed protein product [Blepharisma stoltei]|uniref:Tetratricopeptide repeat protein n=1 Tax=Blepharisma stoltei TaxID=1481888 RepID=A0AAU9JD71_9CILI|nr:unnamed protein product [Blepharisma stoltei]